MNSNVYDRDWSHAAYLDRGAERRECGVCQYCRGDEITGHAENCRVWDHLASDDHHRTEEAA